MHIQQKSHVFLKLPGSPAILLGPLGTGKSTWLKETYPEAIWIDLLEPNLLRYYAARPERLREVLQAYTGPKVIVIFVVYGEAHFAGIEIKNAARLSPKDFNGLVAFKEEYPEAQVLMIYRGRERMVIKGILCLPCEEFLLGLKPQGKLFS